MNTTHAAKIDTRYFDHHLRANGMSRRQLAKRMHCDPASVYRLMHGIRPMRLAEAGQIASIIGAPVTDVLQHAGLALDNAPVAPPPVIGVVDSANLVGRELVLHIRI